MSRARGDGDAAGSAPREARRDGRADRARAREAPATFCGLPTLRPDATARRRAATPDARDDARDATATRVRKLLLVRHGAKAKTTRGKRDLAEIGRACAAASVDVETATTEGPGHAVEIVRDADLSDVDAIGVVGGDGTLREAVQGWVEREASGRGDGTRTPIFAFPCGTGNNYARDLGVFTVADAMAKVKAGNARPVDAVRVSDGVGDETISINVVTWGMARDAAETAEGMRWMGGLRYDVAGLMHILRNKKNNGVIGVSDSLEGDVVEESNDYLMMFAQNTRCSGRGFAFTPLARLDDGFFDVVVCNKGGPMHTKALFDATKTGGGHVEDRNVSYVKAKRLSLKTTVAESVGIDGEVTVPTPVHLTALEGAFTTFR